MISTKTESGNKSKKIFDLIHEDVLEKEAKSMWFKRSLTKGLEYIDRNMKILITPCDDTGFSISVYPEYPKENRNILINVGFGGGEAYIQDVCGNGEGSEYQDKGYGTLLVNLALQVLRYTVKGDILVRGQLSDVGDSDDREKCKLRRSYFWTSFGFHLKDSDDKCSPMKAYLSELKHIDRGLINGYLPTTLNVYLFYRYFNRPEIPYEINRVIKNIDENKFSTKDIPDIDAVSQYRDSGVKWSNRLSSAFLILSMAVFSVVLYPLVDVDNFLVAITVVAALFFISHNELSSRLLDFMPAMKSYKRLSNQRRTQLDQLVSDIVRIEKDNGGLIWRAYKPLSKKDLVLKRKLFDDMSACSEHQSFEQIDIDNYSELILEIKKSIVKKNSLYDVSSGNEEDFLFGNIRGGMCIFKLVECCNKLTNDQFQAHINRVLRQSVSKIFVVTVGSSREGGFLEIVKSLKKHIMLVEFYRDGEPYQDMNILHVKLFLAEGILDFKTHWVARNSNRADDLVCAVAALFENNLIDRTFITHDKMGYGYDEKLFMPVDPVEFLMEIFDLINCRWMDEKTIGSLSKKLENVVE